MKDGLKSQLVEYREANGRGRKHVGRIFGSHREPSFSLAVAQALGYSNTRKALLDHVDEEDKLDGVTIRDAIGRIQKIVVINESGLYALILSSKLPQAFKASVLWSWREMP